MFGATIGNMPASDAVPLPRLGEVFFDVRGNSRSMRLSWYAETGVAVFSIWQGGMCTGTFRLPITDLPRMIDILRTGPGPARSPQGAAGGHGPADNLRPADGPGRAPRPAWPRDDSGYGAAAAAGYSDAPLTGSYLPADSYPRESAPGSYSRDPASASYPRAPVPDGYPRDPASASYSRDPASASYPRAPAPDSYPRDPVPDYGSDPLTGSYSLDQSYPDGGHYSRRDQDAGARGDYADSASRSAGPAGPDYRADNNTDAYFGAAAADARVPADGWSAAEIDDYRFADDESYQSVPPESFPYGPPAR